MGRGRTSLLRNPVTPAGRRPRGHSARRTGAKAYARSSRWSALGIQWLGRGATATVSTYIEEALVGNGAAPANADTSEAPLQALAERLATAEAAWQSNAEKLRVERIRPPTVVEVAEELFVEVAQGKLHRQATRMKDTPPEFGVTTWGLAFAGMKFTLVNAFTAANSNKDFCDKCVAPAKAAHGQVGVYGLLPQLTHVALREVESANRAAHEKNRMHRASHD